MFVLNVGQVNNLGNIMYIGIGRFVHGFPSPICMFCISVAKKIKGNHANEIHGYILFQLRLGLFEYFTSIRMLRINFEYLSIRMLLFEYLSIRMLLFEYLSIRMLLFEYLSIRMLLFEYLSIRIFEYSNI